MKTVQGCVNQSELDMEARQATTAVITDLLIIQSAIHYIVSGGFEAPMASVGEHL